MGQQINKKQEFLIDSMEFRTPLSVRVILTLLSPIIAPLYLLRKFSYGSYTLKIEFKYKK